MLARNCTRRRASSRRCCSSLGAVVDRAGAARSAPSWTSDGPGSGYFPFYIGLILCIASAGILYQAVLGKKRDTRAFVDREQLVRVLSVLLPAMFYVLAIVFIGIYVASAIYIAVFMIVLGKYPAVEERRSSASSSAPLFFVMFEVWFKVPLYKGSLDPLAFLGY